MIMARIDDQTLTPNEPKPIIIPLLHPSNVQSSENLGIIPDEELLLNDPETCRRVTTTTDHQTTTSEEKEESGRERLARYRREVAGRVCVPDMWDQESLLKDWIDSSVNFDASLVSSSILSARSALIGEAKRSRSSPSGLQIANRCT